MPDAVEALSLYVVYLGGDVQPGRMGEDHEVVLVVADSAKSARRTARAKWKGTGKAHIDAVAVVRQVDGHPISLGPGTGDDDDVIEVDPTYAP